MTDNKCLDSIPLRPLSVFRAGLAYNGNTGRWI